MRILLLAHSFNNLAQRVFCELSGRGHELSVEFDVNDQLLEDAVSLFRPDIIVAPYLRRAIPESVWRRCVCLIVHPGPVGDQGPSAIDWALMKGVAQWGVTVLQAEAQLDGGPVWAAQAFAMRPASKSSLYRNEVTEAAVQALLLALERFEGGRFSPAPVPSGQSCWRPLVKQADRAIDWSTSSAQVLARLRAADGHPGVLDHMLGQEVYLFDPHEEDQLRGAPGEVIARRGQAVCRATGDGAVWIGHLRKKPTDGERTFKLPAAMVLGEAIEHLPHSCCELTDQARLRTLREIRYEERNGVGYLHFPFYNGAMSTEQCERLLAAYRSATSRPTRVIALMGGPDFWSNGIHLHVIEAADSAADESWRNINAMNDLVRSVIATTSQLTIAALQGNAAAGGVFFALAADFVLARRGVILNPHYKSMGNLYGSEYWTYLLPKRVGVEAALSITQRRLPMGAGQARALGLIDDCFGENPEGFRTEVERFAEALANSPEWSGNLEAKRLGLKRDMAVKPIEQYGAEELAVMHSNFYGFDPSYHVARFHFVHKVLPSRTPLYLASHRRSGRVSRDGSNVRVPATAPPR
jgi:putative two-component system hydrogenase maturation factor HypX/HoxX